MVDVILVSYNRPFGVRRAIRSVLNQSSSEFHLYVADDGSDFDINEVMEELAPGDERIHSYCFSPTLAMRRSQVRYSFTITRMLSISQSPYICYLCDDDWLYPDWIQTINEHFDENPSHSVIYGQLMYMPFKDAGDPEARRGGRFPRRFKQPGGQLDHCQVAHRRECLRHARWQNQFPADGRFFNMLHRKYEFIPIPVFAVQKSVHEKNLVRIWNRRMREGVLEGLRE